MTQTAAAALVHALGFSTGIVLYAMLGGMTLRAPARVRGRGADRIPLATAGLGLVWNVGALAIYGARDVRLAPPGPVTAAVAFAALGFLPAVVVHAALEARGGRWRRPLTGAAYALSTAAAALHLWSALARGEAPSRAALLLLTGGFAAVLAPLAVDLRRSPGGRGPLAAAALAAFAVMALHLSHHAAGQESVAAELVGHHASIPLVLVILYQDYRFALADLFLKRALVVVGLVVAALGAHLLVALPYLLPRLARDPADGLTTAALLGLSVATALLLPVLRRAASAFVDRVVLRRPDYAAVRRALTGEIAVYETPDEVLDRVCALLAPALSATWLRWRAQPIDSRDDRPAPATPATPTVLVPTADAPAYAIEVGPLTGGRRLLSDDHALLETAAALAGRRIDAVRVAHERCEREAREQELGRLTTEAELRALRAQLNPHFLFNALTTVAYLLRASPDHALDTLMRLTALLRAVLRPSAGELVTLGEELEIVEAYLAIERARFEDRLEVVVDVPAELRGVPVLPLLLQPLVENAVKHGVAPLRRGGRVRIAASVDTQSDDGPATLRLVVEDTGAGARAPTRGGTPGFGLGLASVEQRLALHYGGAASVTMRSTPNVGATVEITLPLGQLPLPTAGTGLEARAEQLSSDDRPAAGADARAGRAEDRERRSPLALLDSARSS